MSPVLRRRAAGSLPIVAVILLGVGSVSAAQVHTGRIDVVVEDMTGSRVPGATLGLTGQLPQAAVSDARGETHFLNLPVGTYTLAAEMKGFNRWKSTELAVEAGGSIFVVVSMSVAGGSENVVVTADAPVLDPKKQTTTVNVGAVELASIPTARDPWVILQSVPGIVVDRVNVGGSESGQQSLLITKGANGGQTVWNMDGVPFTDMSALASPFYFDFDTFAEISVTTGGADPKSATGGVQLNFMLKSGTNAFRGQAKGFLEDPAHLSWMQADNTPSALKADLASQASEGAAIDQLSEWGGDLGGPVLGDRWWFWGAWGRQDIRVREMADVPDRTLLQNASFRTHAQLTPALRGSLTFYQSNKKKWGRDAGPFVAQEATLDQSGVDGPGRTYKVEVNATVGSSLFLAARYGHVKQGFQFQPRGGMDAIPYYLEDGVRRGTSYYYVTRRPDDSVGLDGNWFKGRHELKFGFSWRRSTVHSSSGWPGDYLSDARAGYLVSGSGYPYVGVSVSPPFARDAEARYWSAYAGDTITLGRLTANAGARFDRQASSVLDSVQPALAMAPRLLPAVTAPGVRDGVVFRLLQPRAGLTWSVEETRKTQIRATYAMFTDQMAIGQAGFLSIVQYRWLYLDARDLDGDHVADPNEVLWETYAAHIANGDYGGFDPQRPDEPATTINRTGAYTTPTTHEVIVGVDRQLMRDIAVSASYTWRRIARFNWSPIISGDGYIDGTDYTLVGHITGSLPSNVPGSPPGNYAVPYYALAPGTPFHPAKGTVFTARPDYYQGYGGLEVTAVKRMSNRWMARVAFGSGRWREYFESAAGMGDPTPVVTRPNVDGGDVLFVLGGTRTPSYVVQPRYQLSASGAVQLPKGIDVAASYLLRQGFGIPWSRNTGRADLLAGFRDPLGSSKNILLAYPNHLDARTPAVGVLDVRIGMRQRAGRATVNFDLDVFNALNSATILSRQASANSTQYTKVSGIVQPRVMRFGLRVQF